MAAAAGGSRRHVARNKPLPQKVVTSIIDGLKQIYFHKVCVHVLCVTLCAVCDLV
jgi:hypothetical protein